MKEFIRLNVQSDVGHLDRERILKDHCHGSLFTKNNLICIHQRLAICKWKFNEGRKVDEAVLFM